MNNIKYSLKEFKNSIFLKLLIIVQIIIAVTLLYRVIEIKNYENGKLNLIEEITKNRTIYTFSSKYGSFQELIKDQEIPGKFEGLSKDVKEKYNVVTTTYGELLFNDFQGIEYFIDKDIEKFHKDKDYKPVNSLQCSYNFFDVFGLKLSEGTFDDFQNFTEKDRGDWGNKDIPIVLGDTYKEFFKVNDIIEGVNSNYKVVGFLKKNQFFLDKGLYDANRAKNLNTFAIIPSSKDLIDTNLNNSFIVIEKDKYSFDEIDEYIINLTTAHDVKLALSDPSQNIKDFEDMINYNANIKRLIVYIIMAFVIIGIAVIFSNRIAVRKKEFSLHIMHGATFKDIYLRIFLEHLYPVILSIIASFIYIHKNRIQIGNEILMFDIKAFLETSCILLLIIFFVAIIPIYNIRKNKLNYFIRGE